MEQVIILNSRGSANITRRKANITFAYAKISLAIPITLIIIPTISAHTNGMNKKTYYGKLKRRGLKIADGAGKALASPASDPSGSYTGIVATSSYDVPEQDVDDL